MQLLALAACIAVVTANSCDRCKAVWPEVEQELLEGGMSKALVAQNSCERTTMCTSPVDNVGSSCSGASGTGCAMAMVVCAATCVASGGLACVACLAGGGYSGCCKWLSEKLGFDCSYCGSNLGAGTGPDIAVSYSSDIDVTVQRFASHIEASAHHQELSVNSSSCMSLDYVTGMAGLPTPFYALQRLDQTAGYYYQDADAKNCTKWRDIGGDCFGPALLLAKSAIATGSGCETGTGMRYVYNSDLSFCINGDTPVALNFKNGDGTNVSVHFTNWKPIAPATTVFDVPSGCTAAKESRGLVQDILDKWTSG